MMKPRVVPIVITAAITASALFGGWAIYNQVAVASPLHKAVQAADGVVSASKPVLSRDTVEVDVELEAGSDLKAVYDQITNTNAGALGSRKLELNVASHSNELLDGIWSNSLFAIAEAMETKAYSNIPPALENAAKPYDNVTVTSEMDDSNVYVTLRQEEAVKYVVLPRAAATLEVW